MTRPIDRSATLHADHPALGRPIPARLTPAPIASAPTTTARSELAGRVGPPAPGRPHLTLVADWQEGSLVAEYGLLVVLGATITMLATKWATGGAIWSLFGSVLSKAKALVGM